MACSTTRSAFCATSRLLERLRIPHDATLDAPFTIASDFKTAHYRFFVPLDELLMECYNEQPDRSPRRRLVATPVYPSFLNEPEPK